MAASASDSPLTVFSSIAALLLSVLLLIGGNALIGVTTPLRAHIEGFPDLTIGLLGSAYFAGMLAGTLAAPVIIRRGGHIRAFAAFVSLAVVSVVLMPVFVWPTAWLVFRALIGFVFAGLYAVIEAWINAKATNANRGALYALYQIANFSASATGQLALQPLGPGGFPPFAVAAALFGSRNRPDGDDERRPARRTSQCPPSSSVAHPRGADFVPSGSGRRRRERRSFALGPVFAVDIGMPPDRAPLFTSAIVIGSALGVFPVGFISDRLDRRLVMAAVMIAGAAFEVMLARLTAPGVALIALGFFVGLTTYSLYTLAVSLANDGASAHDMIAISVGLLFIYCVAAIAAPAIASVLMKTFGPQALFLQNAYVHMAIAATALWSLVTQPRKQVLRT